MDFERSIKYVVGRFEENRIDYALIGGFALGLYGITRTTIDLDFIVDGEKKMDIKRIFSKDWCVFYETENVLQLIPEDKSFVSFDIIYAMKELGKKILENARNFEIFNGKLIIKLARLEDIIGLKIQAIVNQPKRYIKEMYDIEVIMERYGEKLEWEKIRKYFEIFEKTEMYEELYDKYCVE